MEFFLLLVFEFLDILGTKEHWFLYSSSFFQFASAFLLMS